MFLDDPIQSFKDRHEAGRILAEHLAKYVNQHDVIVLALPRGGAPIGFEVARRLGVPLDVFVVRKLGMPGQEEFALGAVASGGISVLHRESIDRAGLSPGVVKSILDREYREVRRREQAYRGGLPFANVSGKVVIITDDGIATGASVQAAVAALRTRFPSRIVVAVPIGSWEACETLAKHVDEVICCSKPEPFHGVAQWYADFAQTSDEEVRELLQRARGGSRPATSAVGASGARRPGGHTHGNHVH